MNESHPPDSQRVSLNRRIDRICDELEARWVAGTDPDIAELAVQFDDASLPAFLVEVIRIDREVNGRSEDALRQRYGSMFPGRKADVLAVLDSLFSAGADLAKVASTQSQHGDELVDQTGSRPQIRG